MIPSLSVASILFLIFGSKVERFFTDPRNQEQGKGGSEPAQGQALTQLTCEQHACMLSCFSCV